MTATQDFFTSILYAIDDSFYCHLQTSDNGLINTIQQLNGTKEMYNYFSYIPLNAENKNTLIRHVLAFNSEKHISRFAMFKDNHLVFISYDNFKKGVISSSIPLFEDFIAKFVNTKMCKMTNTKTITQDFFISVLSIFIENNLYCELQSSCNHLIKNIEQFDKSEVIGDYSACFLLNERSKKTLVDNVIQYHSEEHTNYFEIKDNDKPLFIAYDGFEIAQIVSEIQLSKDFIEKYVKTDLCGVVDKI
jgi:hypothetical protein